MFQLTLENERGKQLILHPSTQYVVTNIQGLTPPTATINSSVVALQDPKCIYRRIYRKCGGFSF